MEVEKKETFEVNNKLELLVNFICFSLSKHGLPNNCYTRKDSNLYEIKVDCNLPRKRTESNMEIESQSQQEEKKDPEKVTVSVRVLQILEGVKIYCYDEAHDIKISFSFSLHLYVKNIQRNSYTLVRLQGPNATEHEASMTRYLNEKRLNNLNHLIQCRIALKLNPSRSEVATRSLEGLSSIYFGLLIGFLTPRDIINLMLASNYLFNEYFKHNGFWYMVYHLYFKNTGFSLNIVQWKEAYINKRKESTRRKKLIF